MSSENRWDKEIKNSEPLIDGLDDCNLIDIKEADSKDGVISIDFVDESEPAKKTISFEQSDVIPEESTIEITIEKVDSEVENKDEDKQVEAPDEMTISKEELEDKYELKILNEDKEDKKEEPKVEEVKKVESEPETFMKKTQEYGRDLGTFDIAKNPEVEEVAVETDKEEEEEPIIPINPEISVTTDEPNIKIDVPKDFREIISNKGEILDDYISGDAKFKNISENLQACIGLTKLFAKVHQLGGCFNGLTAKDIVITPNRECMIINKNKVVDAEDENYSLTYNKFCAPEVLRYEARPNEKADIHTLAVLIFGILFKSNPFEGKKFLSTIFYNPTDELLYYANPIFVYSHKDKSNTPVYGINTILIKYWDKYYSEKIKMMFKQIFVEGVEDPESRPDESSIISILAEYKQLRDQIAKPEPTKTKPEPSKNPEDTSKDGSKNTDPKPKVDDGVPKLELTVYAKLQQSTEYSGIVSISLVPGKEILNHLIGYEYEPKDEVVGKVIQNAKNKSIIGIKNLSKHTWIAKKGDVKKEFPSGKVVVLSDGIEIDFYPENISANKNRYLVSKEK